MSLVSTGNLKVWLAYESVLQPKALNEKVSEISMLTDPPNLTFFL